jgi:hypothetical protein
LIQLFHSYNLYFYRAFANVLTYSLMCFPIPTTCSHIFVLPLFAFCTMRCIYPELLTVIAVLYSSPYYRSLLFTTHIRTSQSMGHTSGEISATTTDTMFLFSRGQVQRAGETLRESSHDILIAVKIASAGRYSFKRRLYDYCTYCVTSLP